jgi:prepilin-type N-terminal cleavage/methylation domain-containing protein/prepilin-type processing-associated H-X9-DG protein
MRRATKPISSGFTLVELLVVMAIIGVLIAMLLPAIQAAREAARRSSCAQKVSQLLIALQGYEGANGYLPPGVTNPAGPIRNEPIGQHHSWLIHVLPWLDDENTFKHVDQSASVYGKENLKVRSVSRQIFSCPSESAGGGGMSNYAGCHHDIEAPIDANNNGVLFLNSKIRYDDITDGAAFTIFIGEKTIDQNDLGWMSGTRATLRNTGSLGAGAPTTVPVTRSTPNKGPDEQADDPAGDGAEGEDTTADPSASQTSAPDGGAAGNAAPKANASKSPPVDPKLYVGPFDSYHSAGIVNYGFGDGSVRVLTSIDPIVYGRLGHRADGQLLGSDEF